MTSVRRSPPTQRVVTLLDYFAARPDHQFGLSELARALDMSKPTCLGIVATLVDSAYLTCDPATKTYRLGPALARVGRSVQKDSAAVAAAERRLADLSREFKTSCTASAVFGSSIMIVASTDSPGREPFVSVGQRYPFAPPMGLMHVAWQDDATFEQWLQLPPTVPMEPDASQLRAIVEDSRRRGFLVEALTSAGRQLHSLVAGVAAYDLPDELRELVGEMVANLGERVYLDSEVAARTRYPVSVVAAPTFDAQGRQELVLSLYVGHAITGAEIARRGRALVDVAQAVTEEAGGHERAQPQREGRR
ncbi:MAG TPA: helix-turn-helix domain-containing protein [Jatrophihabitantaceae bacterium]|jgi:DNA-binding IclR family transcriptional regulator|nr:helix-turn-helix domain-containing protein [Jatrophihabitantaceae bacterium]